MHVVAAHLVPGDVIVSHPVPFDPSSASAAPAAALRECAGLSVFHAVDRVGAERTHQFVRFLWSGALLEVSR